MSRGSKMFRVVEFRVLGGLRFSGFRAAGV